MSARVDACGGYGGVDESDGRRRREMGSRRGGATMDRMDRRRRRPEGRVADD